jgi:hypothetical protein
MSDGQEQRRALEGDDIEAKAGHKIRQILGSIGRELAKAVVVESLMGGLKWLGAAVVAAGSTALASVTNGGSAEILGLVGGVVVVFLLAPPFVGLYRAFYRRPRGDRNIGPLEDALAAVTAERDALGKQVEQGNRTDRVLGDWLTGMLIDPFRIRGNDPDRDFEQWLNDIVQTVLRVVLPGNDTVGLAVVVELDEEYAITHRSAGVPPEILRLTPAPTHRPLGECIKHHAPNAETFSFYASGHRHYIVVFPEAPIDTPLRRAPIMTVATMIAHVFRQLGLR